MKKFLSVVVLGMLWCYAALSDDIRDFQVNGMSIGDSLLDFYSKQEISYAVDESTDDKIFILKTFTATNSDVYEFIQAAYKNHDSKKIITGIIGVIEYPDNINGCKKEMKKIVLEVSELFPTAFKKDWGRYKMPTKNGHYFPVTFEFEDRSFAMVSCQDFKPTANIEDNLKISLYNPKYSKYLQEQN